MGGRKRIDPHWGEVERLTTRAHRRARGGVCGRGGIQYRTVGVDVAERTCPEPFNT